MSKRTAAIAAGFEVSEVQAGPGRVWWIREQVNPYGGGKSELVSAAVRSDCRITPLGNARPLDPFQLQSEPPLANGLAVDGTTLYLTGEGIGVTMGDLPPEAQALRHQLSQ